MAIAGWLLAAALAGEAEAPAVRPERPIVETMEVRRAIVTVRWVPSRKTAPEACGTLALDDLQATIAGRPARVVSIDRVPHPRMYWLIVDTSQSVNDHGQRDLAKKEAARWARETLVPDRDAAAVLTIDEDLHLIEAWSEDHEAIARAIESVPPGAQSLLTDALDEVLSQIAGDRREHVVVFWTDGGEGLSLRTMTALRRRIGGAPNARFFPVFVQPDAGRGSRIPPQWLYELAAATGGTVSLSANTRWLEQLRRSVKERWRVSFEVPVDAPEGAKPTLRSRNADCEAFVVPEGPAPGDRVEGRPPPEWEDEYRRQRRRQDDGGCPAGEGAFATLGGLAGCALDLVQEQGVLFQADAREKIQALSSARFALRRYYVPTPEPASLPAEPWRILEALESYPVPELTDDDAVPPHSRHPLLVNGRTFFTIQGSIARGLWESRASYRHAARLRLAAEARADVERLAEDLMEQTPSLTPGAALDAAEASPLARDALAAVDDPTDADLRRAVAAWLGDVSARDLFVGWERATIDAKLRGEPMSAPYEERWASMRRWFALPEHARTLVPLVPGRDADRDVIGFWRIRLPRAYWIAERREGARDHEPVPYDHIPPRPLAYGLLETLPTSRPDLAARLAEGGWHVAELDYAPTVKLWKEDPAKPYASAEVLLVLERGAERVELRATIDATGETPALVRLDAK